MMYKVLVVEDDCMIAGLNRGLLERDGRFRVEGEAPDGREALAFLLQNPVDLILLDVYMPRMDGVELLHALRAQGLFLDAIAVTAAHERETLGGLLSLGVVDYLIKPFTPARFTQALDHFCQKRQALSGAARVSQSEVDALLRAAPEAGEIPKGLQEKTLTRIRNALASEEQACECIAGKCGLSVVTTRRYLSYLQEAALLESRIKYDTGGRPCVLYRLP